MTSPIDFSALPGSGPTARIFEGSQHGGVDVSFFIIDNPGVGGPPLHSHPYEEVFVIQSGRATFTVGRETIDVCAGQIVVAPAGIPHAFVTAGDSPFRSINIHPVAGMVTEWLDG